MNWKERFTADRHKYKKHDRFKQEMKKNVKEVFMEEFRSFLTAEGHWPVSRTPALPVASSCLASGPPGVLRIGICEIGDEVANGIARSGVIVPLSVPTPHSPDPK
ncbi:hypothetical protein U9M48_032862 [Paspalum notatum var. saurae]|uniref:Uncharacterized protein n=1 Tax=Paspalum notatum var. saurae TaxID=547442 RepID=A0AAQ3U9G4_PASNO